MRFHIIGNARIENVGKSQSCMVSKLPIIWKQTVVVTMLLLAPPQTNLRNLHKSLQTRCMTVLIIVPLGLVEP